MSRSSNWEIGVHEGLAIFMLKSPNIRVGVGVERCCVRKALTYLRSGECPGKSVDGSYQNLIDNKVSFKGEVTE